MIERISVLVVEDEALVRLDIVTQLEDEGFEVYEAATADAAIAILDAHPDIHLLFTDVDMPGSMDGLKLAAAVRNRWPPVRIIVTSGHRIVDIADLPDGSMFFSKPYHHQSVVSSFRELMAER
jgi:CheY-like chemotaxis protein